MLDIESETGEVPAQIMCADGGYQELVTVYANGGKRRPHITAVVKVEIHISPPASASVSVWREPDWVWLYGLSPRAVEKIKDFDEIRNKLMYAARVILFHG